MAGKGGGEVLGGDGRSTGPKGITEEQITAALFAAGGVIAHAARKLGCGRKNLRERIDNNATLLQAELEAGERVLDLAESVVLKAINKGDVQAARWFLDRKGKKRGYRTTVEHAGPGGGAIPVASTNVEIPADKLTKEDIDLARRRYFNDSDED